MHVSPEEVSGLKAIGAMTGRELTTNPHTGMPEAFNFGDFLKGFTPMIAGMILGPEVLGASILGQGGLGLTGTALKVAETALPMVGGAATAAATNQNPIMGAVGGYGGANVGSNFAKMGAAGGWSPGQTVANASGDLASGGSGLGMARTLADAGSAAGTSTASQGLGNLATGIGKTISDPSSYTGSKLALAGPLVSATMAGAQEDLYPKMDTSLEQKQKEEEAKYKDELTGNLKLTGPGPLVLASSGGIMNAYATGGTVGTNQSTVSTGGLQDLYGANDNSTGTTLSQDGYGIGRLNALAAEGSKAKAADTFYAMGGPIAFSKGGHQGYLDGHGDGMSDSIPATIEGKQPARLADGEFVIPADVVSHLGNGSSKAGSKRLYAMMEKVRQARTGNPKQGKEINPNKYMPA
jgi:hypothetical protein